MGTFKRPVKTTQQSPEVVMVGNGFNGRNVYPNQIVILYKGINWNDFTALNRIGSEDNTFIIRPARDEKGQQVDKYNKKQGTDKDDTSSSMLIEIIVNAEKVEEFKSQLPKIVDELKKSKNHKYSEDFLNNFVARISRKVDHLPTTNDLNATRDRMTKNWKEMLATINDPEVRKRIIRKSFVEVVNDDGLKINVKLSNKNIQEILMQDPNATFVTNAGTWNTKFGREIVDRSNFFIVEAPVNRWTDRKHYEEACMDMWKKSYDEVMAQYKDAAAREQVRHAIDKYLSNKYGRVYYEKIKVYDVSNTKLIDPTKDPWSKIIVKNNLGGKMASDLTIDSDANNGDSFIDARIGLSGEYLNAYRNWLFRKCQRDRVKVDNFINLPDDEAVYHMVFAYAFSYADKLNQVTTEDRKQFATVVTMAMCAYLGIRGDFNSMKISDELARLSCSLFFDLVPNDSIFDKVGQNSQQANNNQNQVNMVTENMNNNYDFYLSLLKTAGVEVEDSKEDMLSEFFNMLDRMDKSKHNLNY